MNIKPYKEQSSSKKEQVAGMFDSIAHRYDFMNHLLSFSIDKYWRRKAISVLKHENCRLILDLATGTGDFAIEAARKTGANIEGIDLSENMIAVGKKKIVKYNLEKRITLFVGDAESLHYPEETYDAVISAFGVRNFENLQTGLSEIYRVLYPKGIVVILEFSKPNVFPLKQLYSLYFKRILPLVGRLFSKDKLAYAYLPESVYNFPDGDDFIDNLKKAGFSDCSAKRMTFGISTIYTGRK